MSILLVIVVLLSALSPVISLACFQFNFDAHLAECQMKNHDQNCQAQCVLQKMVQDQKAATTSNTVSRAFHFVLPLFYEIQESVKMTKPETLITSHYDGNLVCYPAPTMGIFIPPPKA